MRYCYHCNRPRHSHRPDTARRSCYLYTGRCRFDSSCIRHWYCNRRWAPVYKYQPPHRPLVWSTVHCSSGCIHILGSHCIPMEGRSGLRRSESCPRCRPIHYMRLDSLRTWQLHCCSNSRTVRSHPTGLHCMHIVGLIPQCCYNILPGIDRPRSRPATTFLLDTTIALRQTPRWHNKIQSSWLSGIRRPGTLPLTCCPYLRRTYRPFPRRNRMFH